MVVPVPGAGGEGSEAGMDVATSRNGGMVATSARIECSAVLCTAAIWVTSVNSTNLSVVGGVSGASSVGRSGRVN